MNDKPDANLPAARSLDELLLRGIAPDIRSPDGRARVAHEIKNRLEEGGHVIHGRGASRGRISADGVTVIADAIAAAVGAAPSDNLWRRPDGSPVPDDEARTLELEAIDALKRRDLHARPYSLEEERVAAALRRLVPEGGWPDDPIGYALVALDRYIHLWKAGYFPSAR
ncbi:hypothetical protein [Methylobacterium sp. Leaf118]|uniref:hypothetical protein n=1 Tax=Methylobacterium sp. Leaf118 TaxID=2876562 RepID=UPI001E599ED6|nr:hypothetical protein [Methylobacterium sp. Leaf118]